MTSRTVLALAGALLCALAAAAVWALSFRTGLGLAADTRVLSAMTSLQDTRAEPLAVLVGMLCNPVPYAGLAAATTAAAHLLRGPRAALAIAALLVLPNAVTQVLKRELAEDRSGAVPAQMHVEAASWPSGHSTAAMALALAAVLIATGRWRLAAAELGGAFALAMAGSVVLLGWHFPSDAAGGFAIAGAGACLAAAALSPRASRAALARRSLPARG
jgi:membrane-associated phospholipid phosphatase